MVFSTPTEMIINTAQNVLEDYSKPTVFDAWYAKSNQFWATRITLEMMGLDDYITTNHIELTCPYCDTEGITPIVSDVPGAPDTCPRCGGYL